MKENWEASVREILRYEGGYVNHPRDPGKATNMGITRATLKKWRRKDVTNEDVRKLSRREAIQIYHVLYWQRVRGDELPAGWDFMVFGYGVNSGPRRAVKALQALVQVKRDGILGPVTMRAVQEYRHKRAGIEIYYDRRLGFLKRLPTWKTFGRGWARRIERAKAFALGLYDANERPPAKSLWTRLATFFRRLFNG